MTAALSKRDFVVYEVNKPIDENTWVLLVRSCDAGVPVKDKIVRGEMRISGYRLQRVENDPNETDVTFLAAADPKGNLPKVCK